MKTRQRHFGMTLTETTFVVAIVALLAVLTTPAIKTFFSSLGTTGEVRTVINNALSNARSIAVEKQAYAGVRFQQDPKGNQYLVYIINDTRLNEGTAAYFYTAVQGIKPIKLPENIGIMDLTIVKTRPGIEKRLGDPNTANPDNYLVTKEDIADLTTFTIIFSPQGKVVRNLCHVRNRDGYKPNDNLPDGSGDDIFNTKLNLERGIGFLCQDDYDGSSFGGTAYPDLGYGREYSRTSFVIYDKSDLKGVDVNLRWTQFFFNKPVLYLNTYSGEIINTE